VWRHACIGDWIAANDAALAKGNAALIKPDLWFFRIIIYNVAMSYGYAK
jgi:hypothetical protein